LAALLLVSMDASDEMREGASVTLTPFAAPGRPPRAIG
jgi:hypothetical protein